MSRHAALFLACVALSGACHVFSILATRRWAGESRESSMEPLVEAWHYGPPAELSGPSVGLEPSHAAGSEE